MSEALLAQLAAVTAERDRLLEELDQMAPRWRPLLQVTFELHTVSEANEAEHYMARAKRTARQKDATLAALIMQAGGRVGPTLLAQHRRLLVTFVRLGSQPLDSDNLASSMKHVRDATAHWLGCDDNPAAPVRWNVDQEPHKRYRLRPYVRIEFHVPDPRSRR